MPRRYELGSASEEDDYHYRTKKFKTKNEIHSVSPFLASTFLIYIVCLFFIVLIIDNILPKGLKINDEENYPSEFIAERAQLDLKSLTEFGPRIVGSPENEISAVQFLLHRLLEIKDASSSVHNIEIDIQSVSGSYFLDLKPFGGFNAYGNVQNVIVKLHSKDNQKGILINAHFDSVPTSPGGSDDGINCAVMLEVLRKITQSNDVPNNNIIFLFNGAEESPLQAAHGFITQHKWRNDAQVVINLEAAGSGAKEILFQSGPNHAWLLDYYKHVPHPHGQVAGEEIFQSNLIPSDTDFRLFRDFGNLFGYDLAFARNGYRYHTNHDNYENIPLGSYQHVGDNVLFLVRKLANAPELHEPVPSSKKSIYYDIFGLYMVAYTEQIGLLVNLAVVIFSIMVFYLTTRGFALNFNKSFNMYILQTGGVIISGWILALGTVLLLAYAVDKLNLSMCWYAQPWLLVGLYVAPTVAASALPYLLFNKYKKNSNMGINVQSQVQAQIIRLIWTALLFFATCLRIRAAYAIMIPILGHSLGAALIYVTRQQYSVKIWRFLYEVTLTIPTMLTFYQMILILSLFIPITGRIGSNRNPEIIIGLITCVLIILASSFFIPFVTVLKKPAIIFIPCLTITFITLAVMITPLGFPYSGNSDAPAQQRYMIYHTRRIINDEANNIIRKDSGYFVLNLDRNAPNAVAPHVKSIQTRKSITDDCKNFLVCGFPVPHPRVLSLTEEQLWIPAPAPALRDHAELKLIEKRTLSPNMLRFTFEVTGPSHVNVYFSPRNETKLFKTSLSDVVPDEPVIWNGRPTYFMNYVWGKNKTPLQFYLDIEIPSNWNGPTLDIAISGKEFYNKIDLYTSHFQEFISEFPDWANIVPIVSTFESWIY